MERDRNDGKVESDPKNATSEKDEAVKTTEVNLSAGIYNVAFEGDKS